MSTMSGKLITLEGCEGVGKSTQLKLIKEYCEKNAVENVYFTREPGGTDTAEKIRAVILDPENKNLDAGAELLLYIASRRQHTAELIEPLLRQGATVFCDRYIDSTLAYQGYARGLDKGVIKSLNGLAMGETEVYLTLFLDIEPETGFIRKGGADKADRIENETADFHKKVYAGFKQIAAENKDRIVCVDAAGTKYETHGKIIDILKQKGVF